MNPELTGNVPGATPLEAEEVEGLLPEWVATREELNSIEQENIFDAMLWVRGRIWTVAMLADTHMLKQLHQRMFGEVWKWAGSWRTRDTNLGVDWHEIPVSMHVLAGDLSAQAANPTNLAWPVPELLARFHHRLVTIHPFPNGNGRHARLTTDLLAQAIGSPLPSWGNEALDSATENRDNYLAALRAADSTGSFDPLITFMWS